MFATNFLFIFAKMIEPSRARIIPVVAFSVLMVSCGLPKKEAVQFQNLRQIVSFDSLEDSQVPSSEILLMTREIYANALDETSKKIRSDKGLELLERYRETSKILDKAIYFRELSELKIDITESLAKRFSKCSEETSLLLLKHITPFLVQERHSEVEMLPNEVLNACSVLKKNVVQELNTKEERLFARYRSAKSMQEENLIKGKLVEFADVMNILNPNNELSKKVMKTLYLSQALKFKYVGRFKEAEGLIEKALSLDPKNELALETQKELEAKVGIVSHERLTNIKKGMTKNRVETILGKPFRSEFRHSPDGYPYEVFTYQDDIMHNDVLIIFLEGKVSTIVEGKI